MPKKMLLAAVMACAAALAPAREIMMNPDTLLARVRQYNADVRASRAGVAAARQGVSAARSACLPEVTAQLDLSYLGDGTVLDRDFTNAMRDRLPHFGNTLEVQVYQPVYHGGAITAGIDLARLKAEMAELGVLQQADASGIEALKAYFELLKMHNLRAVYVDNIALTEQLLAHMDERHRQGTALRNDITRYELRLSSLKYDLQTVDNTISVLNRDLTTLLGYDPDDTINPTPVDALAAPMTEAAWQQLTADQSTDLRALDISLGMARKAVSLERAARLPQVGLFAGDKFLGPVTFEIPALDKNYNAWYIGVSLRYSLSSLWKASKHEAQKRLEVVELADRRQAVATALQRRVHQACVALDQARQMLDTERVNVRLANENYTVVETRFDNDMALLTDMLDASTAKLDSEVRLVNAQINVMLAHYQLKFISGTLQ